MKILLSQILIYPLIFLLIGSCSSNSLENCKFSKLEIYGFPSNILSSITISKENVMKGDVKVISDIDLIDALNAEIKEMKEIETWDEIDNRFVIKATCQNSSVIIIESNNYVTKIGNSYFKPSAEFLNLVSSHTSTIEIKDCNCQKANLVVYKKSFQILDSIKINTLKDELDNLTPIVDDGRVIFGDTIIFNCNSNNNLMVLVNEDYIKINNQKFEPRPKLKRVLRKYAGDALVANSIKKALANIDSTKELSLRDCSLKSFPQEIFELYNLEFLDLGLNIIEEIPDDIDKLKNLKELRLSYNLLNKISPNIGTLVKVQNIWLLDNELKLIPNEICKLSNLKELNITGNPISELPNCIPLIDSIQNFYFGTIYNEGHSQKILKQIEEFKKVNSKLNIRI